MTITGNEKQAILYVVTNKLNKLQYFGIIHKEGKTIQQRFDDHARGVGGRYLFKAIQEFGVENFTIEEIERGELEYIRQREVEETANTLFVHGKGYNGNCGKCIILNDEMWSKKIANTNQETRVPKWKETYNENRHKHDYSRDANFLEKQEQNNYSKIRGKTKHECERLQKLADSNKQKWQQPTETMILGKIKSIKTNRLKTEEEKRKIIEKQIVTRKLKREQGLYTTSPCIWITPIGTFKNAEEGAVKFGIGVTTFKTWCTNNKQILKRHHKHNENILTEWDNLFTHDIGFKVIRQTKTPKINKNWNTFLN
jgi:hypothetical protein